MDHNMLAAPLDGSSASCNFFDVKVQRGCQTETVTLACDGGRVIDFNATPLPATYGRIKDELCRAESQIGDRFHTNSVEDGGRCGVAGNVQGQVELDCQFHTSCDILVDDDTFGDQGCPTMLKYFEVAFKCVDPRGRVRTGGSR
jgi:hypothetical protein